MFVRRHAVRARAVVAVALLVSSFAPLAAVAAQAPAPTPPAGRAARDPMQEGLPLKPSRTLAFTTREGSWMSVDVSPDGQSLLIDLLGVVTRNQKLHLYHKRGGNGQQLIAQPANLRTLGAAVSPDGRWIWHARRAGLWLYNTPGGDYQLGTFDRETGEQATRTNRNGSAFRPTLSPDGRWLVYGTRHINETGLRARDLRTGDEK